MTYKRILHGTDGSESSVRASVVASAMAKTTNASLLVATVVTAGTVDAQASLDAALAACEAAGVKPRKLSGELVAGRPADALIDLAEERDIAIVVVGGGRGQRYALGDVAHRLSHHARCDLLIVSEGTPPDGIHRHLLIATDGSKTADRAARKGYDLAESVGGRVTLVFVGHPKTGEAISKDTADIYAGGVPTDIVVTQGEPAARIHAVADDVGADLVVIGNKGMTGAKRFITSSVPARVCEVAGRDVLVCRTVVQAVRELDPGQGGIIEQQGEKLAAFMNEASELHLMSARCTHMGCTVAWNPGERTFDCPCHGSRFGPMGEVVNGPAARPLPPA